MDTSHGESAQNGIADGAESKDARNGSFSQVSHNSQTASDFIDSQLQLEADAREALPYAFDHCTQPLGPLRQNLFSCLTCNPPPDQSSDPHIPAAVCYSCSIACHGEHTLVELFNRRNFTCDCGSTRLPANAPCTLRIDPATGMKGPVHSQTPPDGNTYNQNCRNRFCGCEEVYNAEEEKGTMFQCLGMAGESDGGCGEDWWHPECVVGLGREWAKKAREAKDEAKKTSNEDEEAEAEHPLPPGFPHEDKFETFICYKCVNAVPWIKRYAGSPGFLAPVSNSGQEYPAPTRPESVDSAKNCLARFEAAKAVATEETSKTEQSPKVETNGDVNHEAGLASDAEGSSSSKKRKADDAELDELDSSNAKKSKVAIARYHDYLPEAPTETFSLFGKENFREHFCRCPDCYPILKEHPQLLEEEESYEPPISESGEDGAQSVGTGSLLDRGEAALSNVDRVRAIGKIDPYAVGKSAYAYWDAIFTEGVMVYNHLKDKVKSFLQPFAESGQAVGAEDIKAYFEKLRGDEQGIKAAAASGAGDGGDGGGDNRREQSGY